MRSRFVRVLAAAVGIGLLASVVWLAMIWQIRRSILDELQPVALKNCTLQRYGSTYDGGYLLCENLVGSIAAAYSYGVGPNADWDCDVSKRYGVPVHQYDCFNPARPACEGGTFVFHDECVGDRAEQVDSRVFDTLANQITRNGHAGQPVLMKMDIEGAEWDALLATPDEVLAAVPQLAMELHGHSDRKILEVVRKLKRHFYLANLHFNNSSCNRLAAPFPGWAYQVLWVNKRIAEIDPTAPVPAPMSPLNAPDVPSLPECQLHP